MDKGTLISRGWAFAWCRAESQVLLAIAVLIGRIVAVVVSSPATGRGAGRASAAATGGGRTLRLSYIKRLR